MRSRQCFLVIAATVIACFGLPKVAAAASAPTAAHLVKDCGTFDGAPPSFCTITVSDLEALPPGSKIVYLGPVLDNAYFLSSNVVADAGSNGKATGYCVFNGKTSSGSTIAPSPWSNLAIDTSTFLPNTFPPVRSRESVCDPDVARNAIQKFCPSQATPPAS